ncbi:MAG: hypothetical protein IKK43_02595 [Clostridia bacterium]|nr:hypothetical protein [Clostridia bacterium]
MKGQKGLGFDFLLGNKFKSNATFFMSMIAIALFVAYPTRSRELCMYAILISTLADLVLMDYNNLPGIVLGEKRFYTGMALFGITHVIYMVCFSNMMVQSGPFVYTPKVNIAFWIFSIIFVFSLTFSALMLSIAYKKKIYFCIATIIYVMLICFSLGSMYLCAAVLGGKCYLAAIGITFFWISDVLILIRETKKDTSLIRKLIWVFYPIGQMLIVFSI